MGEVRGKLAKVAASRGMDVEDMLLETVNRYKTIAGVAAALGVAPNAISQWMRRNHYEIRTRKVAEMVKKVVW